ncbi:hypothetical protein M406DRAFT_249609 [Cryphonectria parasitica EP155]|uniref:Capsule polysaccharide biosynthesis protein n=1 Tax=Cryphonectria parasitica (strain ATCC 38755 / EP155) TaxID=660469 RepID=A0A9P5CRU6_CRYP1|nr:uncharacterized protein M406DRAFT_249609 [Cryphonectria parasitica EP155]KAF3768618.1 hypothetical protein M406DRAFT_249609 [Cryphonectria parasitica EP155]
MEAPSHPYTLPAGVHTIPSTELDLGPDAEIDELFLHPTPVSPGHDKNLWFFWHSGYRTMHPYTKRTVRTYHRRFSRKGWTIRVLDVASGSPANVANFLDVSDPSLFPKAFREGTITGKYALQHTSDLVRFPLLNRYGGAYADVGLMAIGDLDALWEATVGSSDPHPVTGKRYEVVSYQAGVDDAPDLTNYFLASRPGNAFFTRCHELFMALWDADGGHTSTEGMHLSPLLDGISLLGKDLTSDTQTALSDYIIQGQAVRKVMTTIDSDNGWDGPAYVRDHIYAMDYMPGSQLINEMTAWDGRRAFELMSLRLPAEGEEESADQKAARDIVEACLSKSFAFKLAHGLILAVLGPTLGSLWRSNEGSDDVPGTYAHWLRYGMIHWAQDELPPPVGFNQVEAVGHGRKS